ncbi:hypothetical protein Dda_4548 [Drechslerella dactyloides]|uniref:Rhodopsin domain-containing protein n=1 Tax=Drechslerella dactyloides TaxID=74499 RepID=A0AAD6IX67_DREDA|nr:hypothetical protein Dda_4548 [Drechslerella dactyloides]
MENGGSLTTLTASTIAGLATTTTAAASTTTGKLYSTGATVASASDYKDDHGPTVSATTIVFLVLAFVSVTLRVIARGFIARRMRIDDYMILVAFALSFGMCLSIVLGITYGFGRHSNTIPYGMALQKQKYQYAFTLLFNPAIALTKASILTFYLLVFKVQKHFRRFCWITMAVVLVAGLALTLLLAFRCSPIGLVFDPESNRQPFPGCIGTVRIYFASAPVNILEDLAIIVLPIPVLTSLRLPNRQKAILLVVFSLGVFDIVVGLIRIHYFQLTESQALDFDYNAAYSFMWAAIEVNVGIVCASIPMTKPLISRFFPTWLGSASLSDQNRETIYETNTYAYGAGTPTIPNFVRRGTIGSTSHRPSIGVGWLSAYGDSHGTIGELGHVDTDGKIITPFRGRRDTNPANRLEAALQIHDNILIKTPQGTLKRINERRRENRLGSIEDSGVSGSTAVQRPSEASSYQEYATASGKSPTTPWESVGSDGVDPLDPRKAGPTPQQPADSQDGTDDIPPWEKLELPGLDDPTLVGLEPPCQPKDAGASHSSTSSSAQREGRKKQPRKTSTSSTGSSSTRAPSIFGLSRSRSRTKPENLSLEIPRRRSSQVPHIIEPGSRKGSQDTTNISPTTDIRFRPTRTVAEPLLPPVSPNDYLITPLEPSRNGRSGSSDAARAPTQVIPERAEGTPPTMEAHAPSSSSNVPNPQQPPNTSPEIPPWEFMELQDVSGKGKARSSTPDDTR